MHAPAAWTPTTSICQTCGLNVAHGCKCKDPEPLRVDPATGAPAPDEESDHVERIAALRATLAHATIRVLT